MSEIDLTKMQQSDVVPGVLEVYKLLKKFKEDPDRTDWIDKVYKRGWEVAYGENDALWSKEEREAMIAKEQIPVAINDIAKGIQGSCALSTANKPGIQVKPIGSSDLYISELIKRGFDYVWQQNRGQEIIFDLVKECKTGSIGWLDIKFDDSKGKYGKIVLCSDDPLSYYFEKKSRRSDKSDSPIIKAHLVTKQYAKENHDVVDEDLEFSPIDKEEEPGKSSSGKPGEDEYARAEKNKDTRTDDKEEEPLVWEIEAWLIKQVKEYWLLTVNPDTAAVEKFKFDTKKEQKDALDLAKLHGDENAKTKDASVEKRILRIIVGKKLISEEENPYGLDSDGDPVVPKILMPHDRSFKGFYISPTYRAIEISKSRNKRRMQTIYVITKNIDAPIVMPTGAKWVNDPKHGDQLEVPKDAAFAPQRLLPGTTSSELMAMESRDEMALNDEFDMNDVMKGKLPPGVDSGKLVIALQDQAGTMTTPFIGTLEGVIEKAAKVILSLMLRHWPRELWERLIDEEEKTSWQPEKQKKIDPQTGEVVPPDPNDVSMKWLAALEMVKPSEPGKKAPLDLEGLDIKIQAGSTTPTNRMAKRLDAMEMVKAGVYPPEIALEYADDPLKDKAIAMLKQRQQAAQEAMMMKGSK
jgi:competence protein ComGF